MAISVSGRTPPILLGIIEVSLGGEFKKSMKYESDYEVLQSDNDLSRRQEYWQLAKGLQKADGLETSEYLEEVITSTLTGDYNLKDAQAALENHYEGVLYGEVNADKKEADIVSSRIVELLEVESFTFSPVSLRTIHEQLFRDIFPYDWVGRWRKVNIRKRQEVLGGSSVLYAHFEDIEPNLNYEFDREKESSYSLPLDNQQVSRLIRFTADLWQIHPFRDGNTRTVSTFLIKYLRSMGIEVQSEAFANGDWFRNALVRYHYSDLSKGIDVDKQALVLFFENVLLDAGHDLLSYNLYPGKR